ERAPAAAEQVDPGGAMAGGAGTLLAIHLLPGALDLGAVLDVVRAALPLGELPGDAAVQDVGARLEAEDRLRQLDRARRLAVKRHDLQFHVTLPPARPAARLRRTARRKTSPRPRAPMHPPPADGTCRAWAPPSAASSSRHRAA